ncbi:MAG: hypothetical protein H7833_12380 [Magnetococcus sp. DMHC-1]
MSGVVKSVSKVFKSVTKNPIVKTALIVGAAYFTAGAAGLALPGATLGGTGVLSSIASAGASLTGATATAGLFSSAASAASTALGSTVGSMVSGALSGAATGAMLGGGMAALTGNKIGKGMMTGGLMGAALGGVQGYFNAPTLSGSMAGSGSGAASQVGAEVSTSHAGSSIGNMTSNQAMFEPNGLYSKSSGLLKSGQAVAQSSLPSVTPLPPNGLMSQIVGNPVLDITPTISLGTLANTALKGYFDNKQLDKQLEANKARLEAIQNSYPTKPIVV